MLTTPHWKMDVSHSLQTETILLPLKSAMQLEPGIYLAPNSVSVHVIVLLQLRVCVSSTATFDVQSVTAKGGDDINVTGGFISNSRALGCFVVLHGGDDSPDELRVLLRNNSDVTNKISVPPSTYTMSVHDLEEDGHINEISAILVEDKIIVTRDCKLQTYLTVDITTLFMVFTISHRYLKH